MTACRGWMIVAVVAALLCSGAVMAQPPACFSAPLSGGYGNAGFASGYSSWVSGMGVGCGPMVRTCRPCWRPCPPRYCLPRRCMPAPCFGWGSGWGGWYGAPRYAFSDSVFLSVPANGSATFFSGSVNSFVLPSAWYPWGYGYGGPVYGGVVFSPYGTWLPAGYAPTFGPAGVLPFLNAFGTNSAPAPGWRPSIAAAPQPPLALTDRLPAVRASNAETRRRALKLVAVGDRHMRAAVDAPGKLSSALDAYRRAATIAPDLPDTFVRLAIALVALERHDAATRALERMGAIDARLASDTADRGMVAMREIWNVPEVDHPDRRPQPNWIADRWTARWQPGLAALAAAAPADRDPAVK